MQHKILIVDDDDLVLACFERLLSRHFAVDTAVGPYAALDAIQGQGPYAVIMSDLRMPGMNGIQLLERAKELSPHVIGILLSGNVDSEDVASGAVYRVLDKPCPPAVLSDTLREALARHDRLTGGGHVPVPKTA